MILPIGYVSSILIFHKDGPTGALPIRSQAKECPKPALPLSSKTTQPPPTPNSHHLLSLMRRRRPGPGCPHCLAVAQVLKANHKYTEVDKSVRHFQYSHENIQVEEATARRGSDNQALAFLPGRLVSLG